MVTDEEVKRAVLAQLDKAESLQGRPFDRSIFDQAVGFHETVMRAGEPRLQRDGTTNNPIPPAIVCAAFACELYLKALLASIGTVIRKHELKQLYDMLPQNLQDQIEQQVRSQRKDASFDVQAAIEQLSLAFVDWRYLFEKDRMEIFVDVLIDLMISLFKVCVHEHPSWRIEPSWARRLQAGMASAVRFALFLGGGRALYYRDK